MSQSDAKLLRQFVDAFSEFDDMIALGNRPGDLDLAAGEVDELGFQHWQPRETSSDPAALESLYSLLPFRYPALFEQLLLTGVGRRSICSLWSSWPIRPVLI